MKPIVLINSLLILLFGSLLFSCDDSLDIQEKYNFTLEIMPVQENIQQGETVEIRCELIREGKYENTIYTIRYFQENGKGMLQDEDGTVFLLNDRYSLEKEVFRLYYTSQSNEQQTIDITIEDSFNQRFYFSFTFNPESKKDDKKAE